MNVVLDTEFSMYIKLHDVSTKTQREPQPPGHFTYGYRARTPGHKSGTVLSVSTLNAAHVSDNIGPI